MVVNYEVLDVFLIFVFDCEVFVFDGVELVIFCLGVYEFKEYFEVLYCVVLDEVIEFVKYFGGVDSYKYINGVLDCLVIILCVVEK